MFACKHLPVIDGRGRYMDNIFIERLWRSLKQEAVYLHEINDGFQAKRIIDNWIGFYTSERPHTALDKRTPDTAYFGQAEILNDYRLASVGFAMCCSKY